ncbi:dynactin subunit 4-like [Daktulosphaira vitifoliae]|uniref:dynactin subunit 4-like n=1 Tax=Daktulosphaira vitifoliae TaxID=58002 RepID=UPI0021A9FFDE|nr:dynactin subunit 4-like [Daktulosphaira vitifoliae]XP_050538825.1 dynactin subunit 4-like [Daktulosphaira vitifoliae]XP_050538826.1 dynactin subunit 4-like [Daktulosphaira vitifoliae]
MAVYMVQKTVMSFCTCGLLKILPDLFFCRHCLTLRCDYCVSHEIDTTFCPHCFENLSSTEAKHKKNRCASCLECPRCFNTLSTRSYSRQTDPKKPPQKLYYLLCLFCNWRSHEPIVPDQPTSSGNWPIYKNPNEARITELINYYKSLTLKEIFDKQKKSTKNYGRNYMHFLEKFGLNAMMARKRAGLPNFPLDGNTINTPQLSLAEAVEDVPELPNDIFEADIDFKNISTLEQRFATPDFQDENIDNLYPIRKHLHVKHSLRCRVCEHNVVKPEYNAVKFKIKHLAYYHVPEIKVIKCDPLQPGKVSQLILKLCNPAQTLTVVSFEKLNLSTINEVKETRRLENDDQIPPKKLPESININLSLINDIVIPKGEIKIAARDDTAEYDDTNEVNIDIDDPKYISWRKGNKVALKFEIQIPDNEEIKANVQVGFVMNFTYLDTIPHVATLPKQPQSVLVPLKIVLNLPSNI